MATIIRMPEVLAGATEAAIQSWLVDAGMPVAAGQPMAEIETDKATVELMAETTGTIGRLLALAGDSIAIGDAIAVVLSEGEADDAIDAALAEAGWAANTAASAPAETPADAFKVSTTGGLDGGNRLFASPLVRRLAAQNGVEITQIVGSGPNGRIVRRDLERHLDGAASAPAADPTIRATTAVAVPASSTTQAPLQPVERISHEDIPLDRMRKAIARRLSESKATVPHFYLNADCRVDALLALRGQVNESAPRKISVNDFVIKAAAAALVEVPAANAIWNGDSIRRFTSVDISIAVSTDNGLTTPVLRGIERMPLTSISSTVADLAERGRAGRLKQHELEGGSFSISNLGMFGTTQFSAILNPPQSGILAVGAARLAPIVGDAGELTIGSVMTVTLSADHRVLDGAVAAQWLAAFQRHIENPLTILI